MGGGVRICTVSIHLVAGRSCHGDQEQFCPINWELVVQVHVVVWWSECVLFCVVLVCVCVASDTETDRLTHCLFN